MAENRNIAEFENSLDSKTPEESYQIARYCARTLAIIAHSNGLKKMEISMEMLEEQGIDRGDWTVIVESQGRNYIVQ
jgi:hypothetical protein